MYFVATSDFHGIRFRMADVGAGFPAVHVCFPVVSFQACSELWCDGRSDSHRFLFPCSITSFDSILQRPYRFVAHKFEGGWWVGGWIYACVRSAACAPSYFARWRLVFLPSATFPRASPHFPALLFASGASSIHFAKRSAEADGLAPSVRSTCVWHACKHFTVIIVESAHQVPNSKGLSSLEPGSPPSWQLNLHAM